MATLYTDQEMSSILLAATMQPIPTIALPHRSSWNRSPNACKMCTTPSGPVEID